MPATGLMGRARAATAKVVADALQLLGEPRLADLDSFFAQHRRLGESARFHELDRYEAYYWGLQHDAKRILWDGRQYVPPDERASAYQSGQSIAPMTQPPPWYMRRPYIRYQLSRAVVDRFTGLLYGEGRTPTVEPDSGDGIEWIAQLLKASGWWRRWALARTYGGAMGSVVVGIKLRAGRPIVEVWNSKWCTPRWKDDDPECGELEALEVCYKTPVERWVDKYVDGKTVRQRVTEWQWYRRILDTTMDVTLTAPVKEGTAEPIWSPRGEAVVHGLGFVPAVWVRNVDVLASIDGSPDCDQQWDNLDALDALLSDAFQGTHYNADPTLVVKSMRETSAIRTGSMGTILLDPQDDAKLLELAGTGGEAAEKRALTMRDVILLGTRCVLDVSGTEVTKTATETRKLHEAMYGRADELRGQYGEAMERLFEMLICMCRMVGPEALVEPLDDVARFPMPARDGVSLEWPAYVAMDAQQKQQELTSVVAVVTGELLSRATGARIVARTLGEDPDLEAEQITKERTERMDAAFPLGGEDEGQDDPEDDQPSTE